MCFAVKVLTVVPTLRSQAWEALLGTVAKNIPEGLHGLRTLVATFN